MERLSRCILKYISHWQNTNMSDNCSMQDYRPLPRHITTRLRERCPVWHFRPTPAPPWDGAAFGGQCYVRSYVRIGHIYENSYLRCNFLREYGPRSGERRSMTAALLEPRLVRCWVAVLYSSNPVNEPIDWLPVKYRVEYKLLVIVFRSLHDQTSYMFKLWLFWILQFPIIYTPVFSKI